MNRLAAGIVLALASTSAHAVTYYVRTDGGTSTQCTGRADAAYDGSGTGEACAFSTPSTGIGALAASDTLIIGNGSYEVASALPVPPSGTSAAYTRILGQNHAQCRSTPELWGSGGRSRILDLSGRSYIEVACFELTDHHACMESHPSFDCTSSQGARAGIYAYNSRDLILRDIHSHGVAYGFRGGKVHNLTMERVRLNWNSRSGFEGATPCTSSVDCDSFSGTIALRNVEIAWNGCGQNYPSLAVRDCFGDNRGGYGDGLGTKYTGGAWIVEDSSVHHNTSDGLDLRYTRAPGATVTIRRSSFFANAGNQVKAWGRLDMQNSYANSWCGYFGSRYATNDPEACRASGNTVIVIPDTYSGVGTILRYNTIAGHGAALIQLAAENDAGDLAGYSALIEGNVVVGATYYLGSALSKFISNSSGIPYTLRNNHVYNAGSVSCTASQCVTTNPRLRSQSIATFDPRPASDSPVLGAGDCTSCSPPVDDIRGKARPASPARGAFEFEP
jgi:hypothetical protein